MSGWELIVIRELDDGADGVMYPVPGEAKSEIEHEPADGSNIAVASSTGLSLHRKRAASDKWHEVMAVRDINLQVYVTDCRVAVACSRFDKGGGWIGTSPLVLPMNALSMARAASRRRGKMLVGQVRYPWLGLVGAKRKTGLVHVNSLRLIGTDRVTKDQLQLILTFKSSVDPCGLAQTIAGRAARFRLDSEPEASAEERQKWQALVEPPPLNPAKGKYDNYGLAPFWLAHQTTAYGKPVEQEAGES